MKEHLKRARCLPPGDTNSQPDIFLVALDTALDTIFAGGFEP